MKIRSNVITALLTISLAVGSANSITLAAEQQAPDVVNISSETDGDVEIPPESETASDSESEPNTTSNSESEPDTSSDSKSKPETNFNSELEPETDSNTETGFKTCSENNMELNAEIETKFNEKPDTGTGKTHRI